MTVGRRNGFDDTMNSVMKAWADLPPIFADRLMALLSDEGRVYHGLHHINQLLLDADRYCHPHWLKPLRWAILYHDAIYDPLATGGANERFSADLWLEHFSAIHETARGVAGEWEADVATAIVGTINHFDRAPGLLPWQHALLDLDIGGLGASPDLYEANRLLILSEFTRAGGTPERWIMGRETFLTRAIACDRLFHVVHTDREAAARLNVRHELEALRPALPKT